MRFSFRRRIRHPFYPALTPSPAAATQGDSPALFGAVADLKLAAQAGTRVERAIFPLVGPAAPFLKDRQRDELWEQFQVPVYALLVDGREGVVGYECEAQEGLHLREDYAAGLLVGRLESALCECGRPGPRLVPEHLRVRKYERAQPEEDYCWEAGANAAD